MAEGETTPAVFVSQLGKPSPLPLTRQRQCRLPLEVSSSGSVPGRPHRVLLSYIRCLGSASRGGGGQQDHSPLRGLLAPGVFWPAEVLGVREPRNRRRGGDAGDSQGHGGRLPHQTLQQMRENLWGITQGRESRSCLCFRKTTLGWDVRCTMGWGAVSGPDGEIRHKIRLGPGLWV